jgi:FtsP/CotA-like multicopper oxidase with cupredoxin domain
MRAEVGDLVEVLVSNKLSKNYVSLHSMGLGYNKDNEGSLYPNNTSPDGAAVISEGDAIPPGGCFTYKWFVPNASAPTAPNPSKFWAYHSYINMPTELDSGLMGPFIVYAKGKMNITMSSNRELVILYNNFNEANSLLAETNDRNMSNGTSGSKPKGPMPMQGQGYGNYSIWHPQVTNMPSTILTAKQAPSFHSLNGYVFANMPSFEMCVDDNVIWYLYAFGAASHVFHLHGNNFKTATGEYMAGHAIADGEMSVLTMSASTKGKWDLICHVNNHLEDGMVASYVVTPRDQCNLPKLTRHA